MAITVDVKPNLDRFVQASEDDLCEVISSHAKVVHDDAHAVAAALLEQYVILPR